jgi:hypothetical protein
MSLPLPDRELRRLIVDLAVLSAEDIAAILEELVPEQRTRIAALIGEFTGFGFGEQPSIPEPPIEIDRSHLSPWLVDRIDGVASDGTITVRAREALRRCALQLHPAAGASGRSGPDTRKRRNGFAFVFGERAS